MWCVVCLEDSHDTRNCPVPTSFAPREEEPRSDADDAMDAVRMRYIAERVAKGAYRRLAIEHGLTIPSDVLSLDPDAHLYQP
jgi:hypothetical protein